MEEELQTFEDIIEEEEIEEPLNNEIFVDTLENEVEVIQETETLLLIEQHLNNIEMINSGILVGIGLIVGVLLALILSNYIRH